MLRNQVNPHFLFNNLNTISSLVYDSPDVASDFVRQLSHVYRYLLDYQNRDLITLAEEEPFIQAYIKLMQIRFANNMRIEWQIPSQYHRYGLVPVCLQMLVENAVKHNIVSKSKPLSITISITEDLYLQVKNNYQPKKTTEYSTRIGLANIQSRYHFLSNRSVIIDAQAEYFSVQIPLIERNDESIDRRR
jgi:LytS/YehU family sensor histidine kinase